MQKQSAFPEKRSPADDPEEFSLNYKSPSGKLPHNQLILKCL
ncbi:hypothetical protein [Microcoleus sp.]